MSWKMTIPLPVMSQHSNWYYVNWHAQTDSIKVILSVFNLSITMRLDKKPLFCNFIQQTAIQRTYSNFRNSYHAKRPSFPDDNARYRTGYYLSYPWGL
jgi:hypothetical protein